MLYGMGMTIPYNDCLSLEFFVTSIGNQRISAAKNMRYVTGNEAIFLDRLTSIVEANLGDEDFGVSELAEKSGYSRSRLYSRIKSTTQKTASQFIRDFRLNRAQELLRHSGLTTSEIAYRVGFGSPAYFSKCFHEKYGYPPGEIKGHDKGNVIPNDDLRERTIYELRFKMNRILMIFPFVLILGLLTWVGYDWYFHRAMK